MNVKKMAGRAYRAGRKAVKKRYTTKKGGYRIGQITKDIAYLKGVLNPEKKNYTLNNTSNQAVGCFNGNASGHYCIDISPTPTQGSTETTRNGNSIKLHSSYLQLQVRQQSAAIQPIKFKVVILAFKGIPYSSASTYPTVFLNPNPFLNGFNVYDFNSTVEQSFLPNSRIVYEKTFYLAPNNISTQTMIKDVKIPLRYRNHHIKYLSDGSTSVTHGALYMMILADNGNCSSSTATTGQTNAVYTAINTGMLVNYNIIHYYYDN